MSEDQDLMARIGHLAGKFVVTSQGKAKCLQGHINLHKTQNPRGSSMTSVLKNRVAGFSVPHHRSHERVGKPTSYTHKNRSLVFKKDIHSTPNLDTSMGQSDTSAEAIQSDHINSNLPTNMPVKWVAKRDRHMQLINSNVYNNNVSDRNPVTQSTTIQTNDIEDAMVEPSLQGGYSSANQSNFSALTNAIQQVPQSGASGPKLETGNDKRQEFRMSGNRFHLREDLGIQCDLLAYLENFASQTTKINALNSYNKIYRSDPRRLTK